MNRDLRFILSGETVSALGTSVTATALPLTAVAVLDAGAFEVSLLSALTWLPWLVIGLQAGAWVDRLPPRPVLYTANLTCALALVSVPVAAGTGALTLAHLLAVAAITGVGAVFSQTAFQLFIVDTIEPDTLPTANAALQVGESATRIAGPGVAGLIAEMAGAVSGLLIDAASFLISTLCLTRVRPAPSRREPVPKRRLRTEIAEGLRFVVADPLLRVLTLFGAASNLALTGFQSILVVFLIRDIGLSAGAAGLVLSGMSVGGVLGAVLARHLTDILGTARALLLAEIAAAPAALLIPLTGTGARVAFAVVGGALIGTGIVAGNVIKRGFQQLYIPGHLLGRALVTMAFLNYGTIPLGALAAGSLSAVAGVRTALWISVTGVALAPLILLTGPLRRLRDLPGEVLQPA